MTRQQLESRLMIFFFLSLVKKATEKLLRYYYELQQIVIMVVFTFIIEHPGLRNAELTQRSNHTTIEVLVTQIRFQRKFLFSYFLFFIFEVAVTTQLLTCF